MVTDVDRLSERQKECLRLILQGYRTKDIARELGIKPDAVKARLKGAMMILRTNDRFAAARLLARNENYPSGVYPLRVVGVDEAPAPSVASDEAMEQDQLSGSAMGEEQRPFGTPSPRRRESGLPDRGGRNDLNIWQRFGWIVGIAVGVSLAFGGLIAGLKALSELL